MKRNVMITIIFILIIGFGFIPSFIGCNNAVEAEITNKGVTDYGNRIFYFDCYSYEFGAKLSKFLETNQDLEVVTMTDSTFGSKTIGFFVVFKRK